MIGVRLGLKRNELASVLGVSDSYLQAHWQKALAAQKKQGIEIMKVGRGEKAEYGIKYPWESEFIWDTDMLGMI